ncbi:HlyD family efflux transporter periplasmic adaptor subunit [Rhizobium sp. EC-SD404]|uniref:HlyD family secretion protein n=1 Tax=Rhizobium sp. EC-SD404 TaxID=2038389 RepID=UPI001252B38A|nr:HlyD family efflux transporter periplasmic adaptor subunit [Rhizobium sp. EC-SD404]VVT04822.1 Curdlan synthesis protein [Rhizobium sp. EC-SD404]
MRYTRLIVGFAVILGALYIIFAEQLSGASADAVVNAQVTTVRAPIAGTLELPQRALGSAVDAGETLGSISDLLVDNIRLNDLVQERAVVEAQIARLNDAIEANKASIELLRDRAGIYGVERVRQLEAQLRAANALVAVAESRLESSETALARSTELSTRGLESAVSFERAQSLVETSRAEIDNAREQATAIEIALQSAQRGTFLGDGYNDAPYSEQRISELSLRVQELDAELVAQEKLGAALDQRIEAERRRVNRLNSNALAANVNGLLWDRSAIDGETVQRGESVLRLVDCDSAFVTLSVTENVYNRLAVGTPARFALGGSNIVLDGTITRLAGSGARTVYDSLAIAPSERHLERFDVALLVPALRSDPDLRCLIGRTGRAYFESRPLDWIRGFMGA